MSYSAMPSRLMPIDADGTVVGQALVTGPVSSYPSSGDIIAWVAATTNQTVGGLDDTSVDVLMTWCFLPETRTVLGLMGGGQHTVPDRPIVSFEGSVDTTNGQDGSWEAASLPSGFPAPLGSTTTIWRSGVKPLTFTAAKSTVRAGINGAAQLGALHIYGVKYAGQTPDDILFLDGDAAFAENIVDKDFGDRPLGTTVVKQFKLKNSSATKTATTIVVTCNDADFAISTDGVTYVTTFTLSSLGPGVSSAVLYIRNTTPSPGAALGPRQVRLSAAVGSYV